METSSSSSTRAASFSIWAMRSGVSSPAFSSSIFASHSAPSAASCSSTSTPPPLETDLSISSNRAFDQVLLLDLPKRLAVGEDQALVAWRR